MIPAEAVEAAARAHYESSPAHRAGWVQISAGYKKELMEPIRAALEAAAPYMLKSAYDLGFQHGSNEPANPYRSAK